MRIIETAPPQTPKVSIVTPVCNTSRYLGECLDSLMAQTLEDIEMICINDGSTDDSLEILLDYQKRDSRIRVVDKPNSGYGATMNLGFELARGEYVGILESDDVAEPTMFSKLHRFAEWHDCDLVKCNYSEYSEKGDVKMRPFDGFPYRTVFDPRVEIYVTTVMPIIWAALYRNSLIKDNGIRFNETPGASFQDTSFVFQCWASARRAALLPDCLIHYRVDNAGSSVKSSKKTLAVCGEYALSQAFLEADPERMAAFGRIIHHLKLGTYKWNYERIDEAGKKEFAGQMAKEYREASSAGMLDRSFFTDWDWRIINEVMDDPIRFVEEHPEQIYGE